MGARVDGKKRKQHPAHGLSLPNRNRNHNNRSSTSSNSSRSSAETPVSVLLQFQRSAIYASNSTGEVSQFARDYPRMFLLTVEIAIGLSLCSSSNEGIDFDALWLDLLDEARQPAVPGV